MPKVLAGLPPYGPPALSFPRPDSSSEGYVVKFETDDGSWIGNFATPNRQGPNAVHAELGSRFVLVVAAGSGYLVDAHRRQLVRELPTDVQHVWFQKELPAFVISNGLWFEAFDAQRTLWRSRRISWDWIRNVGREGLTVTGEASFPADVEEWVTFELDLRTGAVQGGSYTGPDV
jgi:hypothetical protein